MGRPAVVITLLRLRLSYGVVAICFGFCFPVLKFELRWAWYNGSAVCKSARIICNLLNTSSPQSSLRSLQIAVTENWKSGVLTQTTKLYHDLFLHDSYRARDLAFPFTIRIAVLTIWKILWFDDMENIMVYR